MKLAKFNVWATVSVAAASTGLAAVVAPRDGPLPSQNDPFYVPPTNLSSYKLGQIIDSREVRPVAIQDPAVGPVAQRLYRTTNTASKPSSTVTTVFTPANPTGDPSIFSLQVYEDSANIMCAPSYSLMAGLSSPQLAYLIVGHPCIRQVSAQLGLLRGDYRSSRTPIGFRCRLGRRASWSRWYSCCDRFVQLSPGYQGGSVWIQWWSARIGSDVQLVTYVRTRDQRGWCCAYWYAD